MATPATTIDECIEFAPSYVAILTYANVESLKVQFQLWMDGLFKVGGVFPPNPQADAIGRKITNWFSQHIVARQQIEGPAAGDAGPFGVAAVINAVVRVLYAIDRYATNAQKTATIALFNGCYAVGPGILQLLQAFGGGAQFLVDPMSSTPWTGYTVELTNPAVPMGNGWDLVITIADPGLLVTSVEARSGETANAAGVWSADPRKIGVLIDKNVAWPSMQDMADALLPVGVSITNFGNVLNTDLIDGTDMNGTTPTAEFAVVNP